MATIGRFAFAGVSTAVEVTNALASINVDFSLVKIDPPQEFRDVGQILAPKRRDTAKDGTLHITARRLGAIFESILPETPQLIKSVLYDSVINAWTTGMEGMEALLQGSPMMMQTGDMALALSSWHIYPDLNIVSSATKLVHQKDDLVPPLFPLRASSR